MKIPALLASLIFLTGAFAAAAAEVKIELPPETAVFKPGPGIELAQANCLTCHSADYPRMQPVMPKKFWEALVKKMSEKYGAPVPEESMGPLADYLTAAYGK